MMTTEYRRALKKLTDPEFEKFNIDLGGTADTIDKRIAEFERNPWACEPRICQLLGLKTQEERRDQASLIRTWAMVITAACAIATLLFLILNRP